jgi:hypothetical protein
MGFDALLSVGCTLPQGVAAVVLLWDRFRPNPPAVQSTKKRSLVLALLLVGGTAATVAVEVHAYDTSRAIRVAERAVPCPATPPAQSGDATTKGMNSPANSGSGNSTVYGPATPPDKSPARGTR